MQVLILHTQTEWCAFGENSIYIDDNAHAHTSGDVKACILKAGTRCLDCPAPGPDFRPAKH